MQKSIFQFSNPCLKELQFLVNPDYKSEEDEPIELSVMMERKAKREKNEKEAYVDLSVTIGDKENAPFWIYVTEGAKFRWSEEMDDTKVEKFLAQNASALLLGYIRPIVSSITAASKYSAYNIPFVDFTKEE